MAFDKSLLRTAEFPTIWCPGCGHGIITQAAIRACNDMGLARDDVYAVSGIGCSARTPAYIDFNSIQTTHGRAIAFATGMKMFRPEKHVFLLLGDGDCASIGGNHLIHACRRNIDLTVLVLNNFIYGMTGGQVSPTTPHNSRTTTTMYGNLDEPLDICGIAMAAGATFVARSTAYHAQQLPGLIEQGFRNRGMSLIEILSPCPTGFGNRNNYRTPADMYDELRDNAVPVEKAKNMSEKELEGRIVTGVLKNAGREEYVDRYSAMLKNIGAPDELSDLASGNYPAEPMRSERFECRLSGSGGQGLILAGIIFSEAMIRQGKNAVHTQSYGPEARGGASRSEVVVSAERIDFPEVSAPDILLAMTQDAFDRFSAGVRKGGAILIDSTLVNPGPAAARISSDGARCFEYPISDYAKNTLGDIRTANIVALGLLSGLNGFISRDAMLDSVLSRLPARAHDLNKTGFEHGFNEGRAMLAADKGG
ncbi:MAG: 2-oxoacid:acceptor oxidoreductase family protein [Synergistaceae bacterium]|jgi:2-oxoglutarate ferredoxin oxidoreductase subunit beta|nr:2-oxoacid:acceptor oxidoreductase family protein [Synergistaceae bacterium]